MPFWRTATNWIPKNTSSANATVVLRSAVGEPPNGKPSSLNGKKPTWLRMKMKKNIPMKIGTKRSPCFPMVPTARSAR